MDNDKTSTLYLLRHGQTEDNVNRIIQGHKDSPLTQEGIISTRSRAKKLKHVAFDAVYCSDLKRSRNSLGILLGELNINIEVNYCSDIRELDFGNLTGSNIEDVKKTILFHKKQTQIRYQGGESGDLFRKRVISFSEMVLGRHKGGTIFFMTHFGVIETILKHYIKNLDNNLSTKNYDIRVLSFNKKGVSCRRI